VKEKSRKSYNKKRGGKKEVYAIILLLIIFSILQQEVSSLSKRIESLQQEMEELKTLSVESKKNNDKLGELVEKLLEYEEEVDRLLEILDPNNIEEYEVTGYAPLDPSAKEGVCYSGDPYITASGAKVTENITVAAGPNISFGSLVFIRGIGWRVVQDRGGAITDRRLDVYCNTKEEAFDIGRTLLPAIIIERRR